MACLNAILDNPEDDSLRDAYACFLDEEGRDQESHLVRTGLELAAIEQGYSYHNTDPADVLTGSYLFEYITLRQREVELIRELTPMIDQVTACKGLSEKWIFATHRTWASIPGNPVGALVWRRGLVDEIICSPRMFTTVISRLASHFPIRHCYFTRKPLVRFSAAEDGKVGIQFGEAGEGKKGPWFQHKARWNVDVAGFTKETYDKNVPTAWTAVYPWCKFRCTGQPHPKLTRELTDPEAIHEDFKR